MGQTRKFQLFKSQEQKLNQAKMQRVAELRQHVFELKKKDDIILRLKEKGQTNARTLNDHEQKIRQKDQEILRLKRLLDKHTLDSKSEHNPVSAIGAKQVCIVNTFNDRNSDCILILRY